MCPPLPPAIIDELDRIPLKELEEYLDRRKGRTALQGIRHR